MAERRRDDPPALTFIDFGEAAKAMVAGLREEHPGLEIHVHDIRPAGPEGAGLRGAAESLGAAAHEGPAEAVASGDIVLSTVVAKAAVAVTEAAAPHLKPGPAPRRPELSRARHQAGGGGRRSKFRARANARP